MKNIFSKIYDFFLTDKVRKSNWNYFGFIALITVIILIGYLIGRIIPYVPPPDGPPDYLINERYSSSMGFIFIIICFIISLFLSIYSFFKKNSKSATFYLLFSIFILIVGCGTCTFETLLLDSIR